MVACRQVILSYYQPTDSVATTRFENDRSGRVRQWIFQRRRRIVQGDPDEYGRRLAVCKGNWRVNRPIVQREREREREREFFAKYQ